MKRNRLGYSTSSIGVRITRAKGQDWVSRSPVKWFKRTMDESAFSASWEKKTEFYCDLPIARE